MGALHIVCSFKRTCEHMCTVGLKIMWCTQGYTKVMDTPTAASRAEL